MAPDEVYAALLRAAQIWHDAQGEPRRASYYSSLGNEFLSLAERAYWESAQQRGWCQESAPVRKKVPRKIKSAPEDARHGFDEFWSVYPRRNGRLIGKAKALEHWKKLSLEEKRAAWRGARNYASDVEAGLQIAKDPERWLRDRVWESYQDAQAPKSPQGLPEYDPNQFSVFDEERDHFERGASG